MRTTPTPAVNRAVEAAMRHAVAGQSPTVEVLHLVHGLLAEEEGQAADLLRTAGLDILAYRANRPALAEDLAETLPLATAVRLAVDTARELAIELTGDTALSSEPLLLALLRTDADARTYLERLGFDMARLESLLDARRTPAPALDEPIHLIDVTERVETARILDAGFNRAREALRVIEDHCRFALDDALLCGEVKSLRHDLVAAVEELAPPGLLEARETLGDVGTRISTPGELERASLADVVQVNLKRLQEALRSLEEFGKVAHPLLGERMEQLRYRAYTLERAILLGSRARRILRDAQLYVLLTGASCAAALDWTIAEVAAGGARIIQLREKDLDDRRLLERARQVRQWSHRSEVLFIVNDRPDIARLCRADGVHLGQDDMSIKDARRILGPEALIGVSTHTIEQVDRAVLEGASYIGIGPVFPSETKTFEAFPGLEFVRAALARTSLPAFAIGGINPRTIGPVAAAGAARVAVGHALAAADDPRAVAAELLAALAALPEPPRGG